MPLVATHLQECVVSVLNVVGIRNSTNLGANGSGLALHSSMFKQALLISLLCSLPQTLFAEPLVDTMGVRIGGYGFREAAQATEAPGKEASGTGWQACRMNGLGIFASRSSGKTFFIEGGFDTYFTDSFPTPEAMGNYDTPIDRSSVLLSVSAGARLATNSRFTPYLQAGLGAELTRVRLPALGLEDTRLLPLGFFGAGLTIRVSDRMSVGGSLRVNAMGYYDDSQFQSSLSAKPELATQGQFSASFSL